MLGKETPGVQGRAGGTEGRRGCRGARAEVRLSPQWHRRWWETWFSATTSGHFPRRHHLPNPRCLTGPRARPANLRPRKAWSLRQSVRGKSRRHPAICRRRRRAGLPGLPWCPQLPNCQHLTRPASRWPLAWPGVGSGLQL